MDGAGGTLGFEVYPRGREVQKKIADVSSAVATVGAGPSRGDGGEDLDGGVGRGGGIFGVHRAGFRARAGGGDGVAMSRSSFAGSAPSRANSREELVESDLRLAQVGEVVEA